MESVRRIIMFLWLTVCWIFTNSAVCHGSWQIKLLHWILGVLFYVECYDLSTIIRVYVWIVIEVVDYLTKSSKYCVDIEDYYCIFALLETIVYAGILIYIRKAQQPPQVLEQGDVVAENEEAIVPVQEPSFEQSIYRSRSTTYYCSECRCR